MLLVKAILILQIGMFGVNGQPESKGIYEK